MAINIKDFATVTTSVLPSSASEAIAAVAIEQLKYVAKLRAFAFIDKVDKGSSVYTYFTYDDLSGAYDRDESADFRYDSAGATQSTANFVEIAKGFKISTVANMMEKLNVRIAQTRAAVTEVIDREDNKIITQLASATSTTTAAGVLSATTADPIKDIANAISACEQLGYEADTLLIEQVNKQELMSIIGSNEWYRMTEGLVGAGLLGTFMGLKVIHVNSSNLAHGTGYVFSSNAKGRGAMQIGMSQDVGIDIFDDKDSKCVKVQVTERIAPVLTRPDAVSKISGW